MKPYLEPLAERVAIEASPPAGAKDSVRSPLVRLSAPLCSAAASAQHPSASATHARTAMGGG